MLPDLYKTHAHFHTVPVIVGKFYSKTEPNFAVLEVGNIVMFVEPTDFVEFQQRMIEAMQQLSTEITFAQSETDATEETPAE